MGSVDGSPGPLIGTLKHYMRIPTQGGQVFRPDRGHRSDLMAATVPI
jgi:hypothetical protein